MIRSVHATLNGLSGGAQGTQETADDVRPNPAVRIDASVTLDAIICLEDGKSFKTLKRHLRSAYNMSPEEYLERWGLSPDYTLVAPNYSAKRSGTAKTIGLGHKPGKRTKNKK
ncbi:Transcriptional regulator [Candidatus Rhodobacter oscarellae]|uniref:Transcriptional regulator n=1 Tax=Candidatus Rhodobacter oscarellae TaxID=1675527 RepID=A0A0J9E0E4_9RHOB|nr:Transcriptional regulator [Candidatus Rhodobacter lobularis]